MGDPLKLITDRGVDAGVLMTVEVRPDGAVAVEVFPALGVGEGGGRALVQAIEVAGHVAVAAEIVAVLPRHPEREIEERFALAGELPQQPCRRGRLDVRDLPGSGAAGGLGAGLRAFLGADLRRGVDLVLDLVNLDEKLEGARLVLTGEGHAGRIYDLTGPESITEDAVAAMIAEVFGKPVACRAVGDAVTGD